MGLTTRNGVSWVDKIFPLENWKKVVVLLHLVWGFWAAICFSAFSVQRISWGMAMVCAWMPYGIVYAIMIVDCESRVENETEETEENEEEEKVRDRLEALGYMQ